MRSRQPPAAPSTSPRLLLLLPLVAQTWAEPISCPTYGLKVCGGNGRCMDGVCECLDGFAGFDCAVVLKCDPDATRLPCKGRGACVDSVCYCAPGFSGAQCEHDNWCPKDLLGRVCSSVGTCANHMCHCPSHRSGVSCQLGGSSARRIPTPAS